MAGAVVLVPGSPPSPPPPYPRPGSESDRLKPAAEEPGYQAAGEKAKTERVVEVEVEVEVEAVAALTSLSGWASVSQGEETEH